MKTAQNKIIAKFMKNEDCQEMGEYITPDYGVSWDWLTPVINKCYQEHNRDAYFIQHNKHLLDAINNKDIDKSYKIILEFIKGL
tara:strand:- start:162 stop:413 length:252 start_codon:yes stop_codon:yes gene_type:complete